jgi:hypothetical protein
MGINFTKKKFKSRSPSNIVKSAWKVAWMVHKKNVLSVLVGNDKDQSAVGKLRCRSVLCNQRDALFIQFI